MSPLLRIVDEPGWAKYRREYEQSIIDEFGTTSDIWKLHERLLAARDFLDHMEREAKHVKT